MKNKNLLILVLIGIILFVIRSYCYIEFLGWYLDFHWAFVFALAMYNEYKRQIYLLLPAIIGVIIEITQFILSRFVSSQGYYPGTADLKDILAYIGASCCAYIVIKYRLKKKTKREK